MMDEAFLENFRAQMEGLRRVAYVCSLNYALKRERRAHRYQRIWKRAHRH
jgi:hypothetical protein